MPEKVKTVVYIPKDLFELAIFFWIMQTKAEKRKRVNSNSFTCYFLLNYAIVCGTAYGTAEWISDLLFSFELCQDDLLRLVKNIRIVSLLFSFELCRRGLWGDVLVLVNPTCYFLLNFVRCFRCFSGSSAVQCCVLAIFFWILCSTLPPTFYCAEFPPACYFLLNFVWGTS